MVFFLGSLITNCSLNLDHHHQKHFSSNMLSTSLHNFESEISNSLFQLLNSLDHSDQILTTTLTLPWIQNCIKILLPNINKAFKKLVLDIDYPITNWKMNSIDEYLNYTLNSMELLNSITSSITHLSQALMTLSHALSLAESSSSALVVSKHLKPIKHQPWSSSKKNYSGVQEEKQEEMKFCSDKEWIIHQALKVKKSVWYWVYGVVESSIRGDMQLEMKNELWAFSSPLVNLQLSNVCEQMRKKKGDQLREVANVNKAVVRVIAIADERGSEEQIGDEVNELKGNLEALRKLVEGVKEDVSSLFSEVLLGRNELLDSFQQRKNQK